MQRSAARHGRQYPSLLMHGSDGGPGRRQHYGPLNATSRVLPKSKYMWEGEVSRHVRRALVSGGKQCEEVDLMNYLSIYQPLPLLKEACEPYVQHVAGVMRGKPRTPCLPESSGHSRCCVMLSDGR